MKTCDERSPAISPPNIRRIKPFFSGNAVWQVRWRECMDSFLRKIEKKSGSKWSRTAYEYALRIFFKDPRKNPNSYSRSDVESFIYRKTKLGTDPMPRTINARLAIVGSFFAYAAKYRVGNKYLLREGNDPTEGIEPVKAAEVSHFWTDDELQRFFDAIPRDSEIGQRDRALFLTYFWTVRRKSEIARMKWADIEQNHRFADGHKGVRYFWTGKAGAGTIESAELPAPAWQAIVEYLKFAGRWDTMQPEHALFAVTHRDTKNKCMGTKTIDQRIDLYLEKAGLEGSTHWFRSTGASARRQDGADILELQRLLRHKSPTTTILYVQRMDDAPDTRSRALESKYNF